MGSGGMIVMNEDNCMVDIAKFYNVDKGKKIRKSHDNPMIKQIYKEYLIEANREVAHKFLHTHYKNKK